MYLVLYGFFVGDKGDKFKRGYKIWRWVNLSLPFNETSLLNRFGGSMSAERRRVDNKRYRIKTATQKDINNEDCTQERT